MSKRKKNIEEFFSKYEANFNSAMGGNESEVSEELQSAFSNCFVESSPVGVICGQNNDEFVAKMKQVFQFYRTIGSKSMTISSKDITLIDDFHASAKIYWHYTYIKDGNEGAIDFHNIYLLTTVNNELKIFAFIVGDEMKELKAHGLIQEGVEVP